MLNVRFAVGILAVVGIGGILLGTLLPNLRLGGGGGSGDNPGAAATPGSNSEKTDTDLPTTKTKTVAATTGKLQLRLEDRTWMIVSPTSDAAAESGTPISLDDVISLIVRQHERKESFQVVIQRASNAKAKAEEDLKTRLKEAGVPDDLIVWE
jgi:hypothetical protein